jgi:hypothetical protein
VRDIFFDFGLPTALSDRNEVKAGGPLVTALRSAAGFHEGQAIRYYSAHAGQFPLAYQRGARYPLLSLADASTERNYFESECASFSKRDEYIYGLAII